MKRKIVNQKTNLKGVETFEGESIEQKVERIVSNNEPIKDGAPLIYTEKKDGVQPSYDIRTDRWNVALDAYDKIDKARTAKSKDTPTSEKGGNEDKGGEKTEIKPAG